MGLLIWGSKSCGQDCIFHRGPQVSNFSWQDRFVGGEDKAFVLTFNRPMDRPGVEKHLVINPPLPGKFSWSGRRLAYTLEAPVPYGKTLSSSVGRGKRKICCWQ